jgi:hypothetical protein
VFYNKEIKIYVESEPSVDMYGIARRGELEEVDTLLVDVQPVNKLLVQKEFGIDADVKYRIFSELNEHILDGAYIEYKGSMYRVLNIIEWDDYVEFFVGNLND